MVLLAFSLQAEVEKYGAYVGIAAFFGLAVLSLLYFAQAREVKRLREWAGRAPERAAELEVAVAEHAQEVRRAPVTPVPRPQPVSPSVAVPATNGAVKLKPEEVAALAFARSAGVHVPHVPKAHPVAAAAAAPPAEVAAAGAALATGEPAAAQALNGGGNGTSRTVPAPATPAARRGDVPPPPPLPPRRTAGTPGRRPAAPPPRREGSSMVAVVVTAIIGILVLGGAVFLFTRGGDDPKQPSGPTVESTPTPDAGSGGKGQKATATPTESAAPTKATALIAIYNGTPQANLAADSKGELTAEGYPEKNIATDTAPADQQRTTSVVFYRRGAKTAATGVADTLGITAVQLFDDATQALIANGPRKWNVVVIVGTDKTS
jgi:LytR cell envelope-related transcriptional attenuator